MRMPIASVGGSLEHRGRLSLSMGGLQYHYRQTFEGEGSETLFYAEDE